MIAVPPWDGLRDLGRLLGVPELEELTSSISLAGAQGAHVGERMSLPVAILSLAFIVLIGYPALASALGGFGQ